MEIFLFIIGVLAFFDGIFCMLVSFMTKKMSYAMYSFVAAVAETICGWHLANMYHEYILKVIT